jgi:2-hydroxy-3-keto-5-methylthiopentenyl-1-phosphate phosphatase
VVETLLIACDFDGTITERDTLHLIVGAYGARDLWESIQPRLNAGEVSLEQAMQEEFATVRATPEDVRELVLREAGLRRGFREFVHWARERDHRLIVFSSGFRSVIEAALAHWEIEGLEVVSHEARFSLDGCRLVWSDRGEVCEECGRRCKRHDLRRRSRGERMVYIGDGISDRCGARMADVIFARAMLADDLGREGIPFIGFEDFDGIRERLDSPSTLAA